MSDDELKKLVRTGPEEGTDWVHYKGKTVRVVCKAIRESDLSLVICYEETLPGGRFFADDGFAFCRPASEWEELVFHEGNYVLRFRPIEK